MAKKILPLMPTCRRYVEVFGGGASILLARKPVETEVYNDLDGGLVNFFRVLADPRLFARFYRRVEVLPYSRELFYECHETWEEESDPVIRAAKWFVVARQSFGGHFGHSWGYDVATTYRGQIGTCSCWISIINQLPEISARLRRVQIEHSDFRNILDTYDTSETLFYLDPPYLVSQRRDKNYKYEITTDDHREMVEILLKIKGMALLSGYDDGETYIPLEQAGWEKYTWEISCSAAGRTRATGILGKGSATKMQPRTETVWRKPVPARRRNMLF